MKRVIEQETLQALVETGAARELRVLREGRPGLAPGAAPRGENDSVFYALPKILEKMECLASRQVSVRSPLSSSASKISLT